MASDAKKQLVDFLIEKAFDPVLRKKAEGLDDNEKSKLEHVQRATRSEIERFRGYGSAEEVVTNFHRDLDSAPAEKVHRELHDLHLPTIDQVKDEFDARARELGVRS